MKRALVMAAVLVFSLLGAAPASPASGRTEMAADARESNGWWGQAAKEWCDATPKYTSSRRIRTKIIRSTDNWSNTITSRYRKFNHCRAYQMPDNVWCTTERVDRYSKMCINPRPKGPGVSPCRNRKLDVRGVYYPRAEILRITCVNKYYS